MRSCWVAAIAALGTISISKPANACAVHAGINLKYVKYADIVLIGNISNYRVIRDVAFRKKMLANPQLPAEMQAFYKGPNGLISDYARFDVKVRRVLTGKAPTNISVKWDNSTFGEPEQMATGPFLIALRRPSSDIPPRRKRSVGVLPSQDQAFTVLQAPCSTPFMFESTSEEARNVVLILSARPR